VVVERAAVADAALLDGVGPVGHRGEKGQHGVRGQGGGWWWVGEAAGNVEAAGEGGAAGAGRVPAWCRGFGRRRRHGMGRGKGWWG
jgi:hypothetical protein